MCRVWWWQQEVTSIPPGSYWRDSARIIALAVSLASVSHLFSQIHALDLLDCPLATLSHHWTPGLSPQPQTEICSQSLTSGPRGYLRDILAHSLQPALYHLHSCAPAERERTVVLETISSQDLKNHATMQTKPVAWHLDKLLNYPTTL